MSGSQPSVSLAALAPINVKSLNSLQGELLDSLPDVSFGELMSEQLGPEPHAPQQSAPTTKREAPSSRNDDVSTKNDTQPAAREDTSSEVEGDRASASSGDAASTAAKKAPDSESESQAASSSGEAVDGDGEATDSEVVEATATETGADESAAGEGLDTASLAADPAADEALMQAAASVSAELEGLEPDATTGEALSPAAAELSQSTVTTEMAELASSEEVTEADPELASWVATVMDAETPDAALVVDAGTAGLGAVETGAEAVVRSAANPLQNSVANAVRAATGEARAQGATSVHAGLQAEPLAGSAGASVESSGASVSRFAQGLETFSMSAQQLLTPSGTPAGGVMTALPQLTAAAGSAENAMARDALTAISAAQATGRSPSPALTQLQAADVRLQTALPTSVGQPQWGRAVGERVLWMAAQNIKEADIRLDPPELGQLQVRVSVNQEQASVTFSSPHASVREALDQNAFRLRELFQGEGMNLVNVDVSDQSHRQQGESGNGEPGAGVLADADAEEEGTSTPVQSQGVGLVDHYV